MVRPRSFSLSHESAAMVRLLSSAVFRKERLLPASFATPAWNSADFLWIAFTLFPIMLVAFLLPVQPNDYWWYVRLGGEIAQTGAIPQVDTISSTQAGEPFVIHAWLAALAFWALHGLGGTTATVLGAGLLIAAFYLLVWLTCRQAGAGPQLASALTLMAAISSSNNWVVRPQLFAYPLFGLVMFTLWRWQNGSNRDLWALPVTSLLWVNLHGSFILPFLLSGAALVGGRGNRRSLAWALLGMVAVSFINPRFYKAWGYVFAMLIDPPGQQFSIEWGPPANSHWQATLFYGWLLAFAPLAGLSSRRFNRTEWLWFLGFGWMALSGVRYLIWFLALLAPLSAALLTSWFEKRVPVTIQRTNLALNLLIGVALLLLPLVGLPGIREGWWPTPPPALSPATPVAAAGWLGSHPELSGPVWAEIGFASYLAYALPERKVWIDTRFELYPVEQWERYLEISDAAPGWERLLEEERVDLLMVSTVKQPRLLAALESFPGWGERYRDATAAIFSKNHPLVP
jgi:hypothetical protein